MVTAPATDGTNRLCWFPKMYNRSEIKDIVDTSISDLSGILSGCKSFPVITHANPNKNAFAFMFEPPLYVTETSNWSFDKPIQHRAPVRPREPAADDDSEATLDELDGDEQVSETVDKNSEATDTNNEEDSEGDKVNQEDENEQSEEALDKTEEDAPVESEGAKVNQDDKNEQSEEASDKTEEDAPVDSEGAKVNQEDENEQSEEASDKTEEDAPVDSEGAEVNQEDENEQSEEAPDKTEEDAPVKRRTRSMKKTSVKKKPVQPVKRREGLRRRSNL